MHDILLIIKREFHERVASRSFIIGTLVFPVMMIGLILLPRLVGSSGTEWRFALVSEAPESVAETFVATLTRPPESSDDNTYTVTRVPGRIDDVRESLAAQIEQKEIDAYIALPADVLESGTVVFRTRRGSSFDVIRDVRMAGTRAVQRERLARSGIDPRAVASLVAPVEVDEARLTAQGEQRGGAISTFLTAYVVAFLIYLMTTLYGVAVMRSVLEEKTNRIAEVLMSTIRASHLMAGKIIGVGSAAVAQVLIWVAIAAVVISQSERLGPGFTPPDVVMQALNVPLTTGLLLFLYFLLGFFLYASVFATVGAAVTSEQEAQSVQFIALIPMIAPMLFLETILNAPLGGIATVLGLIPFTSPVTMPMRMAATQVPLAQIAGSLALLIIGIAVVAWLAGKIYRVGILSTGKRPTFGELIQWIRMA